MKYRQVDYQWRIHLARQAPERLPVVVLVLVGAPLLGGMLMGHWLYGLIAFWILFSAIADYLLPIRYEVDGTGVRQHGWSPRFMAWGRVRRVVWGEQGVYLSPFAQPSRWDAFRGIFLWYGAQREQIEQLVQTYCKHVESYQKPTRKKREQEEANRYA